MSVTCPTFNTLGLLFLFITFCLKGSLPAVVVQELLAERNRAIRILNEQNSADLADELYKEQRRYFARIERTLDACQYGPDWLSIPAVAELVANRISEVDGKGYELLAYCIMSNHVHLVVDTANQLDTLQPKQAVRSGNYQQLYRTLGLN